MPTYVVKCPKCRWAGEITAKMGEQDGRICPKCSQAVLRVVIAATPHVWKGKKP